MTTLVAQQLVAHRGLQAHYPENSLLAFEKAIAAGALQVECDVLLSQDGEFFLCHDRNLQRLSGINKNIAELSGEQLLRIFSGEPERFDDAFADICFAPMSCLLQLIQSEPHVHFYIELKRGALVSHGQVYCLQILASALQGLDNVTVISFDQQAMREAKSYGIARVGIVLEHWANRDEIIDYCQADIAFINKERIPADDAITAAVPIVLYEVDDKAEALALLQRGASFIESFCIDKLLA